MSVTLMNSDHKVQQLEYLAVYGRASMGS